MKIVKLKNAILSEHIIPFYCIREQDWKKCNFPRNVSLSGNDEIIGFTDTLNNNIFVRLKFFRKLSQRQRTNLILHEAIHQYRNDIKYEGNRKKIRSIENQIYRLLGKIDIFEK